MSRGTGVTVATVWALGRRRTLLGMGVTVALMAVCGRGTGGGLVLGGGGSGIEGGFVSWEARVNGLIRERTGEGSGILALVRGIGALNRF